MKPKNKTPRTDSGKPQSRRSPAEKSANNLMSEAERRKVLEKLAEELRFDLSPSSAGSGRLPAMHVVYRKPVNVPEDELNKQQETPVAALRQAPKPAPQRPLVRHMKFSYFVSARSYSRTVTVPRLLLMGKWLQEAGFEVDARVEIIVRHRRLCIRPAVG